MTLVISLSAVACDFTPYFLSGNVDDGGPGLSDGSTGDDGGVRIDGGIADAGVDAEPGCVPTPEVCDNADNDCDEEVDEDFNLAADPSNCGQCGFQCDRNNSRGSCVSGICEFECLPGFHDIDMTDPVDGCEYFCIETNGGVEVCDLADNNCDGVPDEVHFDLLTDELNCGGCGRQCAPLNATALCTAGTCGYEPGSCAPGFNDINPAVLGCEYACPDGSVGGDELCNGIDDDCDGKVDEDVVDARVGVNCYAKDAMGQDIDQGVCGASPGSTICVFGNITCSNPTSPGIEQCDAAATDEDCDGMSNEGFDLQNDPNNCNTCGNQCSFPNAVPTCNAGVCEILTCQTGFHDDPDVPGPDCSYACTITGAEICDGVDNDCDKLIDAADSAPFASGGMYVPPNFCSSNGSCAGATVECAAEGAGPGCDTSTITYRCKYPAEAETECGGFRVAVQETLCDDKDNDCDLRTDESFPTKGDYCDSSPAHGGTDVGECIQTGELACNGTNDDVACNYTGGGTGDPMDPDICDGKDNDCDGDIDDELDSANAGMTIDVTGVPGLADFRIYTYEASRPDATLTEEGFSEVRACSMPDVMPWRKVTWGEAQAACAAAGAVAGATLRLCTQDEWQAACGAVSGTSCSDDGDCTTGEEFCNTTTGRCANLFPYSGPYDALACNGHDYDVDIAPSPACTLVTNIDGVLPTGHLHGCNADTSCASATGVIDLSGNLKEWTGTEVGGTNARVMGGSYDNEAQALTCEFDFTTLDKDFEFPNLGFRCCEDLP